jgi:hypothetical protein
VVLFFPRTETPRTHMFLTVSLPQGRFVVDPVSVARRRSSRFRWSMGARSPLTRRRIG